MKNKKKIIGKNWSYNESKALINAYANMKDEQYRCMHNKLFWEIILTDLESSNVLESPTTVEQVESKWRCLCRTYKFAKDRKYSERKTKFLYMKEMDAILHYSPSKQHNINNNNNGVKGNTTTASVESDSEELNDEFDGCDKKRKMTDSLLDIKKQYYADKIKEKQKMRKLFEKLYYDKEAARMERHNNLIALLADKFY